MTAVQYKHEQIFKPSVFTEGVKELNEFCVTEAETSPPQEEDKRTYAEKTIQEISDTKKWISERENDPDCDPELIEWGYRELSKLRSVLEASVKLDLEAAAELEDKHKKEQAQRELSEFELYKAEISAIKARSSLGEETKELLQALSLMEQARKILRNSPIEDPSNDSAWNDLPRAINWLKAYLDELS